MRPLLLLDFDGVLNALRPDDPIETNDWQDWTTNTVDGFSITTSRTMAAATAALATTHWLTTWNEEDKANALLSPLLGIGPFPVAATPPVRHSRDPLWKPRAVSEALADGRLVVWLDDDAEEMWQDWGAAKPKNLFLLAPDATIGLTRQDLDSARRWLGGN